MLLLAPAGKMVEYRPKRWYQVEVDFVRDKFDHIRSWAVGCERLHGRAAKDTGTRSRIENPMFLLHRRDPSAHEVGGRHWCKK